MDDGNGSGTPAANRPYKPVRLKLKPLEQQVFELQGRVALLEATIELLVLAGQSNTEAVDSCEEDL